MFIFYSEIPTTNAQTDSLSGTNSEVTVQLNCYSIWSLLEHCSTNQIWGLELMYNAIYTGLFHMQTHLIVFIISLLMLLYIAKVWL